MCAGKRNFSPPQPGWILENISVCDLLKVSLGSCLLNCECRRCCIKSPRRQPAFGLPANCCRHTQYCLSPVQNDQHQSAVKLCLWCSWTWHYCIRGSRRRGRWRWQVVKRGTLPRHLVNRHAAVRKLLVSQGLNHWPRHTLCKPNFGSPSLPEQTMMR